VEVEAFSALVAAHEVRVAALGGALVALCQQLGFRLHTVAPYGRRVVEVDDANFRVGCRLELRRHQLRRVLAWHDGLDLQI